MAGMFGVFHCQIHPEDGISDLSDGAVWRLGGYEVVLGWELCVSLARLGIK